MLSKAAILSSRARVKAHVSEPDKYLLQTQNKKLSCCCDSQSYWQTRKPALVTSL